MSTTRARGVDVSHHRGKIEWPLVAASGIDFAIIKATDGSTFLDPRFDENWVGLRRAGLLRGAYHFYRPNVDPVAQAEFFLRRIGDILHKTDLPPVLDVEAYPLEVRQAFEAQTPTERKSRLLACLRLLHQRTGRIPIIYTNPSTWIDYFGNSIDYSMYPLWIANYEVSQPNVPAKNWAGQGWTFWQTSYEGVVPGINGGEPPVDLDVYKGSLMELRAWLGWEAPREPAPNFTNEGFYLALMRMAEITDTSLKNVLDTNHLNYLLSPSENRTRPYDGPALPEMVLTVGEMSALQAILSGEEPLPVPPAASFTNQQMINALYNAAEQTGVSGWWLVTQAGLTDLANDRKAFYSGPPVESLPITPLQQAIVMAKLGLEAPHPEPPPPAESTYPDVTNQMMINALYKAAEQVSLNGWKLVEQAGLANLIEDRAAPYTGPLVEELPVSTTVQAILRAVLHLDETGAPLPEVTYDGLLNQDLINLFYRAAKTRGAFGWDWIKQAGLESIAENQQVRYQPYRGPHMEDLTRLNQEQRTALISALEDLRSS